MPKITAYFTVLSLLPVIACDPGGQPADAAAAFPWLGNAAVAIADAPSGVSPSPDGRFVSFTDWETAGIAVRNLETGETRSVTADPGSGFALFPRVSRDGEQIAYAWYDYDRGAYELRVVDWDGSEPFVVESDREAFPTTWSPDGQFVLAVSERAGSDTTDLVLVGTADGAVTVLESFSQEGPHWADFSPDGRFVAYDRPSDEEGADQRDIFVIELAGGQSTRIVDDASHDIMLGWAPDGQHILYSSDRTGTPGVWLLPVSGRREIRRWCCPMRGVWIQSDSFRMGGTCTVCRRRFARSTWRP
jgi:Tol biopolymer transport system component